MQQVIQGGRLYATRIQTCRIFTISIIGFNRSINIRTTITTGEAIHHHHHHPHHLHHHHHLHHCDEYTLVSKERQDGWSSVRSAVRPVIWRRCRQCGARRRAAGHSPEVFKNYINFDWYLHYHHYHLHLKLSFNDNIYNWEDGQSTELWFQLFFCLSSLWLLSLSKS